MLLSKIAYGVLIGSLLCLSACTAGFTETAQFTDGQFADVSAEEWYAPSVKGAYELGFMKGSSDTTFEPNGSMTVAEALTIASRVKDIYDGKGTSFDAAGSANWYDVYVSYAVSNGIIAADEYTDFERPVTRGEMARIFANTVPDSYLEVRNDVKKIPDVPTTDKCFPALLKLYKAGVVMGNDEFGTFLPYNSISRAEAAAIICRVAKPDSRLTKALTDATLGDAYYLLYDTACKFSTVDLGQGIGSAWNIDDRSMGIGGGVMGLLDASPDTKVQVWRDVEDCTDGLLDLDMMIKMLNANDGAFVKLTDDSENAVMALTTANGHLVFNGTDTGAAVANTYMYIGIRMDLDNRTAVFTLNGSRVGEYKLADGTVSRIYVGSDEKCAAAIDLPRITLAKNYAVHELFFYPTGNISSDWTVTGNANVFKAGGQTYNDYNSAKLIDGASMSRSFKPLSGNIVFESYVYLNDDADAGYAAITSGGNEVFKFVLNKDGVFTADGTKLRFLNPGIWQTLRVELDTVNSKALVRINGKTIGTFESPAYTVDGITFGATAGEMAVDDVTVTVAHTYDDYCPEPVPTGKDDGYDVILNICSLWREGTHSGWGAVSAFDDIEPILGYYDEGIIETADWEIKMWAENSIDVAHFCWYAPSNAAEPIKRSNLNFALHEGFFNAKYADLMKFTFMWENSGGGGAPNLEAFKKYIWSYWMDYYFLDPRYYTVDNKLVFTVWSAAKFKESFGGNYAGCKEAIDFMNEDAKAHGFDGVMIYFFDGHSTAESFFTDLKNIGASAAYAYHWNQDGKDYTATVNRLQKNGDYGVLPVIPTVSVGFNNVGWSGERKDMITVADHKKVLEYIRDKYLPGCKDEWMKHSVVVSTWNEYGEGTYVMPCDGHVGFGYLENVAEVISGVKDHSNNIRPTAQQKARLGHIYTGQKTSLKRQMLEFPAVDRPQTTLYTATGDMFADKMRSSVTYEGNIAHVSAESGDSAIAIKTENLFEPVKAEDVDAIRILVKVPVNTYCELFFTTEASPAFTAEKHFGTSITASDDYAEYVFYTNECSEWKGVIKDIRFDITNTVTDYYIAEASLLGYDQTQLPPQIVIGAEALDTVFPPEQRGEELYVVADPATRFFKKHLMAYEWSRLTKVLTILDNQGNTVVFTVGSQTALVNGREVQLAEQISMKDGIPVIPLFFLYKSCGIRYTFEDNVVTAKLSMSESDERIEEVLRSRVPFEYEFELTGNPEGFGAGNATIFVSDGAIHGSAVQKDNGSYDPIVSTSGLEIDASVYNQVVVGMKHKLPEGSKGTHIELFFTTKSDPTADQKKALRITIPENETDDYVEYVFNIGENEYWSGTVTNIRVDPIGGAGDFDIDYIRVRTDPALIEAKKKAEEERLARGFVIENPDAEGPDTKAFVNTENIADVSIVEDELTKSKVWNVEVRRGYGFAQQNVLFIPGVEYEVSYDARVTHTSDESTAFDGKIHVNLRYADETGAIKDHVVSGASISPSENWKHITFKFTVPEGTKATSSDVFRIYTNPANDLGVSFRFDNIEIKKVG